jgi:hypothetical protein
MNTLKPNRLTASIAAICPALMLGLMSSGGAPSIALAFVGLGAALMALVCVLSEFG